MKKPEYFKQQGPQDQLSVLIMALEGGISNIEDGIPTDLRELQKRVEDLKVFLQFLPTRWPYE